MSSKTKSMTTAVYTFESEDITAIIDRLQVVYPDLETISSSWKITHSLYRSASIPSAQPSSSHLRILQLSQHARRTFLCTSIAAPDQDKTAVVAISTDPGEADFRRLLREKMGALWQVSRQGELRAQGQEVEVGQFRIVVANLEREKGVASAGTERLGTLFSVSRLSEADDDAGNERELVEAFCSDLGLTGNIDAWGDRSTPEREASLWSAVLRRHAIGTTARA
jgi:hypothetical protein